MPYVSSRNGCKNRRQAENLPPFGLPAITSEVAQLEQTAKITPGEVITLACQRFLEKLLRRGELEAAFASDDQATHEASLLKSRSEVGAEQSIASATMNEQITQDGLDNLQVVKQAEADFLRQDLS